MLRSPITPRARLVWALALVLGLAAVAGCTPRAVSHPAARAVATVLELRRAGNTDAAKYRPLFADADVASKLASDSAAPRAHPAVPPFSAPYVSKLTTYTADVVVVWTASKEYPGWPHATLFKLSGGGDRWVISDASSFVGTATPGPAPSLR